VAHELNNPLTSAISLIQSTVEDLREKPSDEPDGELLLEDLAFVDKELGRAKTIVRSLLGLSRQTDTYHENVNLNAVVKDACRILHNQYKDRGLEINLSLDDTLPNISGNFATLGQVALNILQNAIHAVTNTGGGISLTTKSDEHGRKVFFECADTGPGIPPAIQKDIFKPFFTTKEVGQGTGLGLYISHEIVRKHGGNLTFESKSRGGCRFVMELPAAG
jgi:two-component system NtrC family sensor kinase